MRFFIRHRDWFRHMAIASFLSLNFFMIVACWTGEDGAWAVTFLIAAIAIICSLIAQFTQDFLPEGEGETRESIDTETAIEHKTEEI